MIRELRAALAVVRKNLRVMRRYPLNFSSLLLLPLYQLLLPSLLLGWTFLVGTRSIGLGHTAGTEDVAGFLFVGALMSSYTFAAFWGTNLALSIEVQTGTLEANWLTPARPESLVLGGAMASFTLATAVALVLAAIGAAVFGARYLVTTLLALPALAISLVGLVGAVYMITAVILVLKQSNFLIDSLNYLFMVGSGVMFPVTVLPWALRWIAYGLPPTYSLDLLRAGALGGRTLLPLAWEYLILSLLAVTFLVLGRWLFLRTERRLRTSGSVGFH
jgi:ABC-2 type transport system permease protein